MISTLGLQWAPLGTSATHPYVEYDKAGVIELLSFAMSKGGDHFAPETRTCIANWCCAQTAPRKLRTKVCLDIAEVLKLKAAPSRKCNPQSNILHGLLSSFTTDMRAMHYIRFTTNLK